MDALSDPRLTLEIGLTLGVALAALGLFLHGRLRMEVVGLLVMAALILLGLVTPQEGISGFANEATVTIAAMFVLSAGLLRTGAIDVLGRRVARIADGSEFRLLVVACLLVIPMSAFINNTPVVVVMIPMILGLTRDTGISPSRLFMPISFASQMGGTLTLIGTSTNLLVAGIVLELGLERIGLFEVTPPALAMAAVGTLYLLTVGRWLTPTRSAPADMMERYELREYLSVLAVGDDSPLVGRSLRESRFAEEQGLEVVEIQRGERRIRAPGADSVLLGGDHLLVHGKIPDIARIEEVDHLTIVGVEPEIFAGAGSGAGAGAGAASVRAGHAGLVSQARAQAGAEAVAPAAVAAAVGKVGSRGRRTDATAQDANAEGGAEAGADEIVEAGRIAEADGGEDGETGMKAGEGAHADAGEEAAAEGGAGAEDAADTEAEAEEGAGAEDASAMRLAEVIVPPRSPVVGRTLASLAFRGRYGVQILAAQRHGRALRERLRELVLEPGDILLVQATPEQLVQIHERRDLALLGVVEPPPRRLRKLRFSIGIIAAVIALSASGLTTILVAALLGVVAMFVTGCLTPDEAYEDIDWMVIVLLGALIPLGIAMQRTGAAELIAAGILHLTVPLGLYGVLAATYLMTSLLTEVISNNAAAVVLTPIAVAIGLALDASPLPFIIAVMLAASNAFLTPIGYQTNTFVFGPGGYRFSDFFRVGAPLSLLLLVVATLVIPFFFPFHP